MKLSSSRIVTRGVALVCGIGLLLAAQSARAQVDMNGPWRVELAFGVAGVCNLNFTQTGTSLSASGTCLFSVLDTISLSGTINPVTGSFSASGSGGVNCPNMLLTLASASLDNRTFFAGMVCSSGPPGGFQGILNGARCGNGVIDAISGEQCDVAIHSCCSGQAFACQYSPPGAFCSDSNQCTDDACDGAGTCVSTNRTGPCDDGNQCTDPDECIAGSCTTTVLPDDSPCEDFNDCTSQSCQAGNCAISNLPDGTPCDDFETCLAGETCLNGSCEPGDPVVCPACQKCYEPDGCTPNQYDTDHAFYGEVESSFQLKKTTTDSARFRWVGYDVIDIDDFGDPVNTTGYELCVFDTHPVNFTPILLFSASMPAGSDWKQNANGFVFKDPADKLKVRLKAGDAGKAKILFKAKGAANPVSYLPPHFPGIEVQLRTIDGPFPQSAYHSTYPNPVTSTEKHYKAEYPAP